MAADPGRLAQVRRIAANKSWARTPNRSERTKAARHASPMSLDYWVAKIRAEGVVREQDIPAAAENAYRAFMGEMSLKAAAARRANAEQRRQPNPLRRTA